MTEKKKVYRFFRVAKELNVGISTLADHLGTKGFDVASSPNQKLDGEMYNILLQEFAAEKLLKEKSEQIREKKNEALSSNDEPVVEEEVIISAEQLRSDLLFGGPPKTEPVKVEKKEVEEKQAEPVVQEKITESKTEPVVEKTEALPAEKAEEPVVVKPEEPVVAKPEEPVVAKPEEPVVAKAEEPVVAKAEEPVVAKTEEPVVVKTEEPVVAKTEEPSVESKVEEKGGLKVLGKIDLDSFAKKGKKKPPSKGKPPESKAKSPAGRAKPPRVEQKVKPVVKTDSPAAKKTPVAKEAPVEEKQKPEEKKSQVIRAADNVPKLSGLTVLGKIELPSDRKKKKDTSSSGNSADGDRTKRKRKRKRKKSTAVDPRKAGVKRGDPRKGGGGPGKKRELSEEEIQKQIKQTLADIKKKSGRKRQGFRKGKRDRDAQRRAVEEQRIVEEATVLEVTEFITANELANLLDIQVNEIITKCMELGMFVSINQRLEADYIVLLAGEYGYEVKWVDIVDAEIDEEEEEEIPDIEVRAPIVTVMGHVDHGKTSLLDYVRKTNVIAGEAGGITQHIGAYAVKLESGKEITFLDTPGHEAFTAMRARGAKVTDVVVIVIAADDAVMPQTKEAINHAQAAGAPMIFAINKIDKSTANPDLIREQLSRLNIITEDWGGKYQSQEISAKTGQGIDELMEKVLLEAEMLELKANSETLARGTVVEAKLDKGRGIVSTFLVQNGTLKMGDTLVAGIHFCKVKAMSDERGTRVKEAGPSEPVQVLGLTGAPQAGDTFRVYDKEKKAKEVSNKRQELFRQQALRQKKHITLEVMARRIALGEFQQLNIIIKGDVDGSIEALADSLLKLSTEELEVKILQKAVGQISESDVLLASASDAIIVGFQVRPSPQARKLAETEGISIRLYSIIYDAIHDVRDAMEGMLSPEIKEEINGTVEIREIFKITKVGTVGGSMVTSGKIYRNNPVRLIRDGIVVYQGKLASLKRFKDDVKEVATGYECGLQIDKYNDIRIGDIVESFHQVEEKRTLN